jgi:hypothetical protein
MIDFTNEYNRDSWTDFLQNNFLPEDFLLEENIIEYKAEYTEEVTKLGVCPSLELSVFEVRHKSTHDARIGLSKDAFQLILRYTMVRRALILFVPRNDNSIYRFSLVSIDVHLDENKVRRTYSNPHRYSFMLGCNCKLHTPTQMLITKGRIENIADLQLRFAVDVITKEFYQELFKWYDGWAVNLVKFPVGEGADAVLPKNPDVEANRQHLIRLITRLIFVWFLRQKEYLIPAWIFRESGIAEVLKTFEPHNTKKGNYYNGIIQNLFFATLNKEINLRGFTETDFQKDYGIKTVYRDHKDNPLFKITQNEFKKRFESVPFLNGGLFECLDRREGSEKQKYVDGFSREKNRAAFIPNCLFFGDGINEGIIDLFDRYNFTVEENTPQDIEIALDPELLGKVFENLLGTYNEETSSAVRSESGSFYTPREIVDYMVDTSLKEYFKGKLEDKKIDEKLNKLFSYHEVGHDFTSEQVKVFMDAIHQSKTLDPACGSGAFPMGVLNKLTFIMEKLDAENELWEELQRQKAICETEQAFREGNKNQRDERLKDISNVFDINTGINSNYARKLYLIENCIYGVDIQPIAIQISKLRFFISLIVDQKTGGTKDDNYNILPLPNLETKFVTADTLIGVKRLQGVLVSPEIETKQQELLDLRHKHFSARKAGDKNKLRKQDKILSRELAELLKNEGLYNSNDANRMAYWNPYDQTKQAVFFDAYWMFGVKNGIDIVIGNPPYIGESGHKYIFEKYKSTSLGERFYIGKMDLFYFFFHAGLDFLKINGILSLITTNYYPTADGAIKLRKDLRDRSNIIKLINFNEYKIFESALGQHNMITQVQRINNPCDFITNQVFVKYKGNTDINITRTILDGTNTDTIYKTISRKDLFNGNYLYIHFASEESSLDSILDKIASNGMPLSRYFETNQGVVPGAMVFTEGYMREYPEIKAEKNAPIFVFTKGELESINNGRKADFIKPFFKNSDIYRYVTKKMTNKELLYSDGKKQISPEVILYIKKFKHILEKRRECMSGKIHWFELQWPRHEGLFIRPKIIIPYRCKRATFAYNDFPFFASTDVYFITEVSDNKTKLKYLLGILNSHLIHTWLYNRGKRKGEMLELFPTALQQIPIIFSKNLDFISKIVEQILVKKETNSDVDTSALERQIDNLVYRLYDLTYDEVKVVEPEFPLSAAEYEAILLEDKK